MSDLIRREDVLEALLGWGTDPTDGEIEYTVNSIPAAEPKEYVKDGTLTVQMPTIKEAKAVDKIVVYADTYKQEYYMPIEETTIETIAERIDITPWYHINRNGKLVEGASGREEALYKAEDIYRILEEMGADEDYFEESESEE